MKSNHKIETVELNLNLHKMIMSSSGKKKLITDNIITSRSDVKSHNTYLSTAISSEKMEIRPVLTSNKNSNSKSNIFSNNYYAYERKISTPFIQDDSTKKYILKKKKEIDEEEKKRKQYLMFKKNLVETKKIVKGLNLKSVNNNPFCSTKNLFLVANSKDCAHQKAAIKTKQDLNNINRSKSNNNTKYLKNKNQDRVNEVQIDIEKLKNRIQKITPPKFLQEKKTNSTGLSKTNGKIHKEMILKNKVEEISSFSKISSISFDYDLNNDNLTDSMINILKF